MGRCILAGVIFDRFDGVALCCKKVVLCGDFPDVGIMRAARWTASSDWRLYMNRSFPLTYFGLLLVAMMVVAAAARGQNPASPVMTLVVDETQAPRRIAFVHEEIRVPAGDVKLAFPKWIPGEHGPTGPIQNMAALRVRTESGSLAWV